ncbi:protein of unknown function (DUF4371) [Popillia japonica]|uniref:Uncharacterized protein n=1 Tax=Popillia japonica TaxID=7064 RepID=A0AAW1M2Q1_POPJA
MDIRIGKVRPVRFKSTKLPRFIEKRWKELDQLQIHDEKLPRFIEKRWKELDQRLKNRNTIDDHLQAVLDTETEYWRNVLTRIISIIKLLSRQCLYLQAVLDTETEYWRNVLTRIISIIKLLSRQCLALRGSTEKLYAPDNGHFLKLVEVLAEYDIVMKEHVRKIKYEHQTNKNWSVTYLSNTVQDEIITLMGSHLFK